MCGLFNDNRYIKINAIEYWYCTRKDLRMKMKRSLLFLFIVSNVSLTILESKTHVTKNQKVTLNKELCGDKAQEMVKHADIDHFLSQEATPSVFSVRSLRNFFTQHSPQPFDSIPSLGQRKTSISDFQSSFLRFIKEEYNKPNYAEEFSQDATHVIEFLEISDEMNLSVDHIYVCLRLFYNKLKAAEALDDTVTTQLLNNLPILLKRHFNDEDETESKLDLSFIKKSSENLILSRLTDHHTQFRATPDLFISNLAHDLCSIFNQEQERLKKDVELNEYRERLRQTVIRFFETALNKVVWNPKAPEGIWNSFIGIGNGLRSLATNNIINHMDDLDDMFKSLTLRFCYNVDLFGGALPLQFFDEVDHDLNNGLVLFLEAEEQDAGIKSKKNEIRDHLIQAKTKALAYVKNGIISQAM